MPEVRLGLAQFRRAGASGAGTRDAAGGQTMSQAAAPKIQNAPTMSSQVPLPNVMNSVSGVVVMSSMHGSTNPTLNRTIRAQASHMLAA